MDELIRLKIQTDNVEQINEITQSFINDQVLTSHFQCQTVTLFKDTDFDL